MMPKNEAETRAKLIDPAIQLRGWTEAMIRREETLGAVELLHGKAFRKRKGRIDYVLRVPLNQHSQPLAIALLEAKREDRHPGHGLTQAKQYASALRQNVRFVYSSNGHQFVEFDRSTQLTTDPMPMSDFPTPETLMRRYEEQLGYSLSVKEASPLNTRYPNGEGIRRYYQDAAIRAVLEKLAECEITGKPKCALLSMATGCGKTFIAVYLLKRISDAGRLRRALFICDREELRSQAVRAFRNVFGADAAEVYRTSDGSNNAQNARIHIATYQTLGVTTDHTEQSFLVEHYEPNYFSHIIIDECHRSAWGEWKTVLDRNREAAHIGLTATPRRFSISEPSKDIDKDHQISADNINYFGAPIYDYSIFQAIEDGYLARCEVHRNAVDIDNTGLTKAEIIARTPVNPITGTRVDESEIDEQYTKNQFELDLILPDRVAAMCEDLFNHIIARTPPPPPPPRTSLYRRL